MIQEMGKAARAASRRLANATTAQKNSTLLHLADCLWSSRAEIIEANRQDIENGQRAGLSASLIDRLMVDERRLQGVITDLRGVADLPDPIGEEFEPVTLPNGLKVHKQHVPLGVLAVIYESRPNVTIDVVGLALKSGNAVILRGGKEALYTNRAMVKAVQEALAQGPLPLDAVQFIDNPDRSLVLQLMQLSDDIDMLIPRGSAALHQFCKENSRIPVITGGIGICHLFVDESANQDGAVEVIRNAKIQRPTVCNALDTALVHRSVASVFLPRLVDQLSKDGVSFRADPAAMEILQSRYSGQVLPAGEADFDTEWLSLVLGLKVVDSLDEAIQHIAQHSTGHSDGILTRTEAHAHRFTAEVDSAAVYVNASTRFTDGSQLGLGAEIAISTQRLHARGPMGLKELTTYKWVIVGDNTIRG